MNVIGPIVIVVEALWIALLLLRVNAKKKLIDQLTGYLAGILNSSNLVEESVKTISLYYGLSPEKLIKMLERAKNESKTS